MFNMLEAIPRLPVSNIQASCAFYKEKLGFEVIYSEEGYARLTCDKIELHLFKWTETNGITELVAESCRIRVRGVNEFYKQCEALNLVHPNGALTQQPWGETDFTIIDLDNNAIDFYE